MIPSDVASRLQSSADIALRPTAPVQEITDKLSDLVAGQRVMAEIQALLPNGTYRAMINQRNITLALPFSAKSGDTLELLVTESDGKLALAVVSHQEGDPATAKDAVSATLSRTGQLISNLFSGANEAETDAKALPLNGNRPIASAPPSSAQDIVPLLKEAITQSGMFYESHQAEWVEGRLPKAVLLQEPQGKLSTPAAFADVQSGTTNAAGASPVTTDSARTAQMLANSTTEAAAPSKAASDTTQTMQTQSSGHIVAPQTQAIVHHQLEALASQTFVWQGQIWPGQDMRWEIEEDGKNAQSDDATAENWRTTLELSFPRLGGVNARLHLHDNQIALSITGDNEKSLAAMQSDSETLRQQLSDAGLTLTSIGFTAKAEPEVS